MSIEKRVETMGPRVAGIVCAGVACMLAVAPARAQENLTGVSRPDETPITVDDGSSTPVPVVKQSKPSAAVPMTSAPASTDTTVYGAYVPYHAPGSSAPTEAAKSDAAFDPDANIVTTQTAGKNQWDLEYGKNADGKGDPDAGIVTHVALRPGEVPEGTVVKAKLREDLSTLTTQPGTKFTAEITSPVMRESTVIVPAGSVLEGRVTWVRGGKRIGGAAALHLEPRMITLPDGGVYMLHAQVIDTDGWDNTKVDNEGTIVRSENSKRNAGVMGLTTGGGAAAGAMIAGVPGALVGAGVGAGVSTVMWLKEDHQAELPKDMPIVFSLTEPMATTPMNAAVAPAQIPYQ